MADSGIADSQIVTFLSKDGDELSIPYGAIACSIMVTEMLTGTGSSDTFEIDYTTSTIEKVITFCEKTHDPPENDWIQDFLDVTYSVLMELIAISSFLGIESLQKACNQHVADMLETLTTEQMNERLGIENDFTPEQKEENDEEYKWADKYPY